MMGGVHRTFPAIFANNISQKFADTAKNFPADSFTTGIYFLFLLLLQNHNVSAFTLLCADSPALILAET